MPTIMTVTEASRATTTILRWVARSAVIMEEFLDIAGVPRKRVYYPLTISRWDTPKGSTVPRKNLGGRHAADNRLYSLENSSLFVQPGRLPSADLLREVRGRQDGLGGLVDVRLLRLAQKGDVRARRDADHHHGDQGKQRNHHNLE